MEFLDTLNVTQLKALYIGIAFIGATLVAWTAWKARGTYRRNMAVVLEFLASVPNRIRSLRDPVFRKRMVAAATYEMAVQDVLLAKGIYEGIRNEPSADRTREDARTRRLEIAQESMLEMRKSAAKAILSLDDEGVRFAAERVHAHWLAGASSVDEVVAFLEEERDMLRRTPDLMASHVLRFSQRFGVAYRSLHGENAEAEAAE